MALERNNLLFPDDEDQLSVVVGDQRTHPGTEAGAAGGHDGPARTRARPVPAGITRRGSAPRWLNHYLLVLIALDTLALLIGGVFGRLVRFGDLEGGAPAFAVTLPAWLLTLAASRSYEPRVVGLGSEEFRRVANAAARYTAVLAIGAFMFRWDVARGLVALTLPASAVLALLFRFLARKGLHAVRRRSGVASHRVLVVGDGRARDALVAKLDTTSHHGLRVVGTCDPVIGDEPGSRSVDRIRRSAVTLRADTLAVAHSAAVSPELLRRISWALEGSGVDLLVAPALTDVAGPRIHVRPVPGLPLLQIAEPEFRGPRRLAKAAIDLLGSAALLAGSSPLLLVVALAVRASGPGPVLFRQTRIGRDGRPFTMYKFRSMHLDAEVRLAELLLRNDHCDGVLFKLRDDPRITPVGRHLRRYSLDELPQLLNVLLGQMSLVGPRPPLPSEVARYAQDVHRRLLVKPGLTGLWQVSGRSDLNWDETVRLDLYYVENWSAALDAEILWKTLSAVLRGNGAR